MNAEHARRCARLRAAGWRRVGDGWELTATEERWSVVSAPLKVVGRDFEDSTFLAYRAQAAREAEALRRGDSAH